MQTGQFASAPDAVRLIVTKEGFRGLYAVWLELPISKHPHHWLKIQRCIYNAGFQGIYRNTDIAFSVSIRVIGHFYCEICHLMPSNFVFMSNFESDTGL